jgi:hypothetical protein
VYLVCFLVDSDQREMFGPKDSVKQNLTYAGGLSRAIMIAAATDALSDVTSP